MTPPFAPETSISYETDVSPVPSDVYRMYCIRCFCATSSHDIIAHAPCHVTYHPGAKMVHISEIPDPNLPIHFVTVRALRRAMLLAKIAFIPL